MSQARSREDGFTLVEVLAVLFIVAMVTGLSAFALANRQNDPTAEAFAEDMLEVLSSSQQKAIISGKTTSIIIDLRTKTVIDEQTTGRISIPDTIQLSMLAGQELIEIEDRVPVYFFGQGGSTGIRIDVTDAKGRTATVSTNWLTGISHIETGSDE